MAAPRASLAYAMVEPTAKLMAAPTASRAYAMVEPTAELMAGPTVGPDAKV